MTLRLVLITFSLGLVFAFFTNYIFVHLSPFDLDALQELVEENGIEEDEWDQLDREIDLIIEEGDIFEYLTTDAYLGFATLAITVFGIFTAIHLGIDKLFFKKFFEPANVVNAVRRGILFTVGIGGLLVFYIMKFDNYLSLILVAVLVLSEIFISNIWGRKIIPKDQLSENHRDSEVQKRIVDHNQSSWADDSTLPLKNEDALEDED